MQMSGHSASWIYRSSPIVILRWGLEQYMVALGCRGTSVCHSGSLNVNYPSVHFIKEVDYEKALGQLFVATR